MEIITTKFLVPESNSKSEEVSCGIAINDIDKYYRRVVATKRYLKEGYISKEDLCPDGTYFDKYELYSIPLVAKIDGQVVASMRLIQNTSEIGLPNNDPNQIKLFTEWKSRSSSAWFEVSQLAKDERYPSHNATLGLIRSFIVFSLEQHNFLSVAVIDDAVRKMLNGPFMGFGLPEIGDTVHYMGSKSTPVFIDVRDLTANSRKNGHNDLADFLEGNNNVVGFEWYMGP